MILNDFTEPKLKFGRDKLDALLADLCGLVIAGQQDNPDFNGMVGAAVIDPQGRLATGVNYLYGNYRVHAERAAIDKYEEEYGELPKGSVVVTTLSPCSDRMDNRYEESCADLLNSKGVKLAYCGYSDPTQENTQDKFTTIITKNSKIKELCKKFADTFLDKGITEETNKQILSYIKKIHPRGEFKIDQAITDHPEWELTQVPLSSLHIESDDVSPYGQINHIDYDHVRDITAHDIKNKPIVVDNAGWIIDGNHRAVAARDMGMTAIPAYVPVESDDETYDQHMARINKEREISEDKDFNQCYEQACKVYDQAEAKGLNPTLVQVAGYTGDGSTANSKWLKIPGRLWQHYVTVVGDMVLDPTAKQFGPDKATKYPRSQLDRDWDKQYQIKPKEVTENFADGKGPGRPGDSQRHGIPKGATMAELEKASHAKGRKGQLARWQLNMRRGKKK
jgi:pyrimidine deaminase RibD-like protein